MSHYQTMPSTPQLVRGSDVVEVARSLINTPFKHQGRIPQVGVDCVGLILLTAWTLGLIDRDYNPSNYSRIPDGSLMREMRAFAIPAPQMKEGVIAVMRLSERIEPHHVGIITRFRDDWGIIHAYQNVGRVREHGLGNWWRNKIVKLYQLPNVSYD